MKKLSLANIMCFWLSAWIFILLAVGCTTGTAQLTPTPRYSHYYPPDDSFVRLEFDYPITWAWMQIDPQLISVEDPYEPTLPVIYDGLDLERGSLWIYSEGTDTTSFRLESEAETVIEFMQNFYPNELIGDRIVEIDGHPGRWLTFRVAPNTGFGNTENLIFEDILFSIDDVHYRIAFQIAESNRFGSFGTDFDYMIGSIQVVP